MAYTYSHYGRNRQGFWAYYINVSTSIPEFDNTNAYCAAKLGSHSQNLN